MALSAVAAYLQFLRKGRGLSQQELAEQVEVAPRDIEHFERASGDILEPTLQRIVAALGASQAHVDYLLAADPQTRDERAQLIRQGIDLARAWLRGEDLLRR